jgi:hypothetical protein
MKRFIESFFLVLSLALALSAFPFQSAYSQCVDPSNPIDGDICGGSERKKCCKPGSDGQNYCCYEGETNIDSIIDDQSQTPPMGNCEVCE